MRFQKLIFLTLTLLSTVSLAQSQVQTQTQTRTVASEGGGGGDSPVAWTHLAPSPAVIPNGEFVIGTSAGVGIGDVVDFSTNLVLDLEQELNVMSKIAIYHDHDFAVAPFVMLSTQSITTTDQFGNQSTSNSTAWFPGATVAYRLDGNLTADTSFMAAIRNPSIPMSLVQNPRTSLIQGSTGYQELTFGFSRKVGLSTGVSYDFSYQIWGAGASIHISGFQIGGQFYFNVGQGNFLPILAVGYAANF